MSKHNLSSVNRAVEELRKHAARLGVPTAHLESVALWNMVADLEGANEQDAREIACIDQDAPEVK